MATQVERAIRQAGLHIPNLEETGRKLGEGSYGEVVEVRVRGKRYAGKKLHKAFYEPDVLPAQTAAIAQRFEEECRRMPQLKHSNIVQMIGVHFHPLTGQPTLVMELMDTSLTRYLEEHASVPLTVKHSILLGVANGLVYLHSLPLPLGPIVHRDLTANNILLSLGGEMIVKIADLGQARIMGRNPAQIAQKKLTMCPGNVDHMPPEAQVDDPEYGTALDVFSFGVLMLHTLVHEWPEPLAKLANAFQMRSEVDRRKTYLDKIEGSLLEPLVVECLGDSAESRPVAGELTGALKLAMKLHPQMQSMVETHAHQVEDLQEQLQAQRVQEQQRTQALEQQVKQLNLRNHELSEQKRRLEGEIREHIHEKELLRNQQHLNSSVHPQPGHPSRLQKGGTSEGVQSQPRLQTYGLPPKASNKSPSFILPAPASPYPVSTQNLPAKQDPLKQMSSVPEQRPVNPVHDKRREIIQGIRGIQPVAGKTLKDVTIPQGLYHLAKEVAEEETTDNRFRKVPVYELLLGHIHAKGEQGSTPPQTEATLAGWQQASKALFRYALNLVLAPKRPEFKKMKLSSSFYVYNVARNLHGAEQVFVAMGYQLVEWQGKGGQDLVYEGEIRPGAVLETATDLLVMHEEVHLIRELVAGGRGGHITLEQAIMQRSQTNVVPPQPHLQLQPASAPAPHPVPEPPPEATLYQNVQRQSDGSKPTTYANIQRLLLPEASSEATSEVNPENTTVTQELQKLYQQYPDLAGLPLQQEDTEQPASDDDSLDLYGDDSNPVPVDSEGLYSFDKLPGPVVLYSATAPASVSTPAFTPASEFDSGITSSLVHQRSSKGGGYLPPVEEQPQALKDEVSDGYQQQFQHNYSRHRSTNTDSTESSIDLYGTGPAMPPLPEEPSDAPSNPDQFCPFALPHSTAHPVETNTRHPAKGPTLQYQGSQDDTLHPIGDDGKAGKKLIPIPRTLKQQMKSHSVDEVEPDSRGGRVKQRGMRTSASGSDLLQHEHQSQYSEPSSPRILEKPTPRPRRSHSSSPSSSRGNSPSASPILRKPIPRPRSRSPSPHSSRENSPSASPVPAPRKVPPAPKHSSQPPGTQLGVGIPPKAQSVDTETQRKKEIRERNPVDRYSSGSHLEAAAAALAHPSQASPSPQHVPESPRTKKSSCDLPPDARVMGIAPQFAVAARLKQRNGLSSNPSGGQPSPSQPLSGQPPSSQPPSQLPSDPPLQSHAPSQPSSGRSSYGQPPSQLLSSQPPSDPPLQSHASSQQPPSQPSQRQQPPSQPSPGQPPRQQDQSRGQLLQRRRPPNELPTTGPLSDRSSLSPPGPLPPKSAPSVPTTTAAAGTVDTSQSDQSDLDQHRRNRQSIESLGKNLGQDNSKLRRPEQVKEPVARKRFNAISKPSNPHRKSAKPNSSAEDEEGDVPATTYEENYKYSLGDTWVCFYCTNLVPQTQHKCDVCGRNKLETDI